VSTVTSTIQYPAIDPVIFRLGPLALKWYGLAYVVGFTLAYLVLRALIRQRVLRLPVDRLSDLMIWLTAGVTIGGRVGWWLFYHRTTDVREPWYEPIAIWHGGMSFHGGLLGVIVALVGFAGAYRVPMWQLSDCAALVTPVGLFLGRLANFINRELVGRPTSVPWGVAFPGDAIARHPSQIYEAILEGPLLLMLLWMAARRRPREGRIADLFLILYGAFRFGVEFTREPDPQIGFIAFGWLTMGQLLSAILCVAGVVAWRARGRPDAETVAANEGRPCWHGQPDALEATALASSRPS
jgi:phosphatidylglycerol:prolipoprotein diacylglycerol transferase